MKFLFVTCSYSPSSPSFQALSDLHYKFAILIKIKRANKRHGGFFIVMVMMGEGGGRRETETQILEFLKSKMIDKKELRFDCE